MEILLDALTFGRALLYFTYFFGLVTGFFFILSFLDDVGKYEKNPKIRKRKITSYPKVTVAIPAWNEEKTLAGTVESLLKLDYPKNKLQIIVVDDGSTDNTAKVAKQYEKQGVEVYTKANGGKGSALNFAIKKATGEFFACLDADSYATPSALKSLVAKFDADDVMAVTPSLHVYKPKTILERLQSAEYLFSIFLRRSFSALNALNVTPGPLSLFRKSFFDKYGGYDESTITEDIEIALRIHDKGFKIRNCVDAKIYCSSPKTLKDLNVQRRRWYSGFFENVWKYKNLFGSRSGNMGLVTLPSAFLSIVTITLVFGYFIWTILERNYQRWQQLVLANYDIMTLLRTWRLDLFSLNNYSMLLFIGAVSFILSISMFLIVKKESRYEDRFVMNYPIYLIIYAPLYVYWWLDAAWQRARKRKVAWR